MNAEDVLMALHAVRVEMEAKAPAGVSLVLREYFLYPSLPVPLEWPDAWRDLASVNARLGRAAGRSDLIPLKDGHDATRR